MAKLQSVRIRILTGLLFATAKVTFDLILNKATVIGVQESWQRVEETAQLAPFHDRRSLRSQAKTESKVQTKISASAYNSTSIYASEQNTDALSRSKEPVYVLSAKNSSAVVLTHETRYRVEETNQSTPISGISTLPSLLVDDAMSQAIRTNTSASDKMHASSTFTSGAELSTSVLGHVSVSPAKNISVVIVTQETRQGAPMPNTSSSHSLLAVNGAETNVQTKPSAFGSTHSNSTSTKSTEPVTVVLEKNISSALVVTQKTRPRIEETSQLASTSDNITSTTLLSIDKKNMTDKRDTSAFGAIHSNSSSSNVSASVTAASSTSREPATVLMEKNTSTLVVRQKIRHRVEKNIQSASMSDNSTLTSVLASDFKVHTDKTNTPTFDRHTNSTSKNVSDPGSSKPSRSKEAVSFLPSNISMEVVKRSTWRLVDETWQRVEESSQSAPMSDHSTSSSLLAVDRNDQTVKAIFVDANSTSNNVTVQRNATTSKSQQNVFVSPAMNNSAALTDEFDPTKFAYAYVIGGCSPENGHYKGFLYNVLVSSRILRDEGAKADIVVFFQMSYKSNSTELPDEDLRLLSSVGAKVEYIPKSDLESFYDTVMNKFRILTLVQYHRVLLMDGDVMPIGNLDYLFEMSHGSKAVPKENIIVMGTMEPANAGFFMLSPGEGEYERLTDIVRRREEEAATHNTTERRKFDEIKGWGHVMEEDDQWESRRGQGGTKWNFHFAFSDQGLLFYWTKYVKRSVSIIHGYNAKGHMVQNWASSSAGKTELESRLPEPFKDTSKPRFKLYGHCSKFMCDFIHFTGKAKPWMRQPPADIASSEFKKDDPSLVWWHTLYGLNNELGMKLNFTHWVPHSPPLGLLATFKDLDKRVAKLKAA